MPAISFTRFKAELLALYAPAFRAKATAKKIRQVLEEFGGLPTVKKTSDINPASIALWIAAHPGRRPATVHSLLRSLRATCSYAREMKYMAVDPFAWRSPAKWLAQDGAEDVEEFDRHKSKTEINRLLATLDDEASKGGWEAGRLQAVIYTYAFTGLRKVEALGLSKSDVDLPDRLLYLRANPKRRLKTKGSAKPIGISDRLAKVLAMWLPRTGSDWVFPGKALKGPWLHGGPGNRALDQIRDAGRRAGIKGLSILSFRHTFGTLGEGWGLGELEMQRWLRHTRRTTQQAYRQADNDSIRMTASKINF